MEARVVVDVGFVEACEVESGGLIILGQVSSQDCFRERRVSRHFETIWQLFMVKSEKKTTWSGFGTN